MTKADDDLWTYNLIDCVRTRECGEVEAENIKKMGLEEVDAFQQRLFWPVLQAMIRGVRIDLKAKNEFAMELQEEISKREQYFIDVLGHPLNPRSPKQMQDLFYEDLKQPIIRKDNRPTLDDKALTKLAAREPLLRPLIKAITEYRSLGVFLSTFVTAPLDTDGRMRCAYGICGTETYRLASSKNAFGTGANMQNIPKGVVAKEPEDLSLPNVRKLYIPDPGFTFFDGDLDRADLQVVAWEANDSDLKMALRMGIDMHCFNACQMFNVKGIPPDELIETHPNYKERRAQIGEGNRAKAKTGTHAVDYYCQARTLSGHLGVSVAEAELFIRRWLEIHPGIASWHRRTEESLRKYRFVQNKFGYKRYYFDRVEGLLPEALAWVPQSTVACVINRVWVNIYENVPEVWVLMQVHDSLAGQFPTHLKPYCIQKIKEASRIVIPYDDPLIIPLGLKTSTESWGAVKDEAA